MGLLTDGKWTPTHQESWRTKWQQEQGMKDLDAGNYGEAFRKMVVLGGMDPTAFAQLHNVKNPNEAITPEDITTYLEHANKQTELNNFTDAGVTQAAWDTYYTPVGAATPVRFSNPTSLMAKLWQERYVDPSRQKWNSQGMKPFSQEPAIPSFQKPAPVNGVASVGGMMGPAQPAAAPAAPATVQAPKLPPTVGDTSAWKAQSMFKV